MNRYSVLLVEDDEGLSKILKMSFERQSIILDLACNGNEALNMLRLAKYDGIISDVDMPECDGLSFIKKLRQSKDYTPVIFYSGRAGEEESKVVQSFGAEGIISKQDIKSVGARIIDMIKLNQSRIKFSNNEHLNETSLILLNEFEDLVFNSRI